MKKSELNITQHSENNNKINKGNNEMKHTIYQNYMNLLDESDKQYFEGNIDKALELANNAKELDPEQIEAYACLSLCSATKDDLKSAEREFEKGYELDPFYSDNYLSKSLIEAKKGNISHSKKYGDLFISLSLEQLEASLNIANVLMQNDLIEEATYYLKKALKLEPASHFAHCMLGRCYLILNKIKQAETELLEAYKLEDQCPATLDALIRLYFVTNKYSEMIKFANLLDSNELNENHLNMLMIAYNKLNDVDNLQKMVITRQNFYDEYLSKNIN